MSLLKTVLKPIIYGLLLCIGFALLVGVGYVRLQSNERLGNLTRIPDIRMGVTARFEDASHNYRILDVTHTNKGLYRSIEKKYQRSENYLQNNEFLQAQIVLEQFTSPLEREASAHPLTEYSNSTQRFVSYPVTLPILMYHKTPSDLEAQLSALQTKGYTAVTMTQAADFFDGLAPLPAKPVVITFDDGFADQLEALELLRKYTMRATYYLIIGGEKSHYCIGITRTNTSCGDSYLSWTEVRTLQDSGIIEIGAHTVDHANLPSLPLNEQVFEIAESKRVLEEKLHTRVDTFAYPYGYFSPETIAIVRQAGFRTAVTTIAGVEQSANSRLTLRRVRNALLLP